MDRSKLIPSTPEMRKAFREYWRRTHAGEDIPYPEWMSYMTCGAKTRAGTPCKRRDLYISGRCKLHGGLSTGPKTEAGKRQSAINLKKASKSVKGR